MPREIQRRAIDYLNSLAEKNIIPKTEYCVCNGKVGSWRMLPNGETCFYCPIILLPSGELVNQEVSDA